MATQLRFRTAAFGVVAANAWTYGAPRAWPASGIHCGDANGQSPIDIVVEAASSDGTAALSFQGALDSATNLTMRGELETNGHTWEVAWDIDRNATDPYGVVWQGKVYRLAQYHYHSPSEHTVHGAHFDMEAHHVHYCVSSNCLTSQQDDEILVVAVFLREGAENPYLQTFWNDFGPGVKEITNLRNPFEQFLPDNHAYYSYMGSTTTPPCVQDVRWILLQESVTLSRQQLTAYRTNISGLSQTVPSQTAPIGVTPGWDVLLGNNNRPLQALGVRTVSVYNAQDSSTALSWHDASNESQILGFVAAGIVMLLLIGLAVCFVLTSHQKKQGNHRAVKRTRAVAPRQAPPAPPPTTPQNVPLMAVRLQSQRQAIPMSTPGSARSMPAAQYMQMQP